MSKELWFATTNKGKLSEIKILMEKELPDWKVFSPLHLAVYHAPPETGKTFLENAQIKVRSLRAMKSEAWVMAEDSGLEVDALNKLPGIHSARYAGEKAQDAENVAKLLKMLQIRTSTNKKAEFRCSLVVMPPQTLIETKNLEKEWYFEGVLAGQIAKLPAGKQGFGYDPVFVPENETQTLAELGLAYKNKFSHRAQAVRAFIQRIKELHPD